MKNFFIYSFYRFKEINDISQLKILFDNFLIKKKVKGTILIANEGINGSVSGTKIDLDDLLKFIKFNLKIRKLEIKINKTDFLPFNRMKIRLKKEIVSLGQGNIDTNKYRGHLIDPKNWNKIISDKNTKVLDVRNEFEIGIGKFAGSINPKTKSFRQFPDIIKKLKIKKTDKIAMYCTGGIRCEKSSAFMKMKGYRNVVQLEGGIIKYLEYINSKNQKNLWQGECFVFDDRVTVNRKLLKGKYLQCYGCRRPITRKETKSKFYKKGVSCPYCYNERTLKQKQRSNMRQMQIDNAIVNKSHTSFRKIKKL